MKTETAAKMKSGFWGLVCGACLAMIIGFSWGGWATESSSQTMAEEAVLAKQAEICIAQFMQEPKHEANLKEFGKLDSWNRPGFIEKGGWDKMPGQEKSDSAVSRACSEGLELLIRK